MAHSYEEIRSAALDILSGREKSSWGRSQYSHLKIGIGELLRKRKNLPEQPHSHYAADHALDYEDSETYREMFWDLFRQGVITLGMDDANDSYPWFRLTSWGRRIADGENGYFVHDVSAYESRIRTEIPTINPVTIIYLKEALQAFRSDCILSATVMLGVAAEHTFLLLVEAVEGNPKHKASFSVVSKERGVLRKLNKFLEILDKQKASLPAAIKGDVEIHFASILNIIRNYRNESGHPSGKIIDREEAYVLLLLFPHYCKKMYQLIAHYSL